MVSCNFIINIFIWGSDDSQWSFEFYIFFLGIFRDVFKEIVNLGIFSSLNISVILLRDWHFIRSTLQIYLKYISLHSLIHYFLFRINPKLETKARNIEIPLTCSTLPHHIHCGNNKQYAFIQHIPQNNEWRDEDCHKQKQKIVLISTLFLLCFC